MHIVFELQEGNRKQKEQSRNILITHGCHVNVGMMTQYVSQSHKGNTNSDRVRSTEIRDNPYHKVKPVIWIHANVCLSSALLRV